MKYFINYEYETTEVSKRDFDKAVKFSKVSYNCWWVSTSKNGLAKALIIKW